LIGGAVVIARCVAQRHDGAAGARRICRREGALRPQRLVCIAHKPRRSGEGKRRPSAMTERDGVDLMLIARQQRQIITDLGGLREDMSLLTAIVLRQDATLTTLLTEVRAMHSEHSRLANRVRQLEEPAQ
jgi:hypothetical protein